jgi:hypothetical protein
MKIRCSFEDCVSSLAETLKKIQKDTRSRYLQKTGAMGECDSRIAVVYLGKPVLVETSDNETGFKNVLKQKDANRKKPYYAKYDPGDGSKQKFLNGSASETAKDAALKLAHFLGGHAGELPPKEVRAHRRPSEVSACRFACPACDVCLFSMPCACGAQVVEAEKQAKRQRREQKRFESRQKQLERLTTPISALKTNLNALPRAFAVPVASPCPLDASALLPMALAERM